MELSKNKIYTSVIIIFWILFTFFIISLSGIFLNIIPYLGMITSIVFIPLMSILGIVLIILAAKANFTKIAKIFFILTGASALGVGLSMVLHNLVFALLAKLIGEKFLRGMGDEPVFFILATVVCPLALIAGVIGSIILIAKKKVIA